MNSALRTCSSLNVARNFNDDRFDWPFKPEQGQAANNKSLLLLCGIKAKKIYINKKKRKKKFHRTIRLIGL